MNAAKALDKAIRKEIEAHTLYTSVARKMDDPAARGLLTELAEEEVRHRVMLEDLPKDQAASFKPPQGRSRSVASYLTSRPLRQDSNLQQVLVYAMKREDEARAFYQTMARAAANGDLRVFLEKLSAMEDSHKARLEILYEDVFLQED